MEKSEDKSSGGVEQKKIEADQKATPVTRESLISSATKFLQNPKIQSSPLHQKREFLLSKGLTNEEIDEACRRAGVKPHNHSIVEIPQTPVPGAHYPVVVRQGPNWMQNLRDVLNFVLLLGGAVYGSYFLWKRYVAKWLFGMQTKSASELNLEASIQIKNTLATLIKSVETLQTSIDAHTSSLQSLRDGHKFASDDLATELKDEIRSVKGILLSTSRFPTNPIIQPLAVPQWQLAASPETRSKDDDQEKITTNGVEENSITANPDLIENERNT